ncbi:hypothetical protein F383_20624 [Gossypium arboreum]|uniref:Uncharacterized protein n=1 Tax=Gossypium arboreum TaxID=29729 RepID=A0A0B0MPV7_GOSAR|nr:hypothetical protein F383_20624 [Gossypium arboreum]
MSLLSLLAYFLYFPVFYSDIKASSDSGIVREYITLSNHHFGTFELLVWSYGMYRIMAILVMFW